MADWFDGPSASASVSSEANSPMSLLQVLPCIKTPTTQNVLHTIVKGRKSWKTYKGGEVVWPPDLEAALLEGLESYQPDDSRETRLLGRFPLRNRFISDYIFGKTGKRRSPKQVGSRLQQLRDTCGGKQLQSLLSPCRRPGVRPSNYYYRSSGRDSESSEGSSPSSPLSPAGGEMNLPDVVSWSQRNPSQSVICIDILPEDTFNPSSPQSPTSPTFSPPYHSVPMSPISDDEVRVCPEPRRMSTIDPTLTFLSQEPIDAKSFFTVALDGISIHSETVPLVQHPAPFPGTLYTTTLVPNFWSSIVESSDPTRYTILHEVVQDDSRVRYSALFKFCYPAGHSSMHYPHSPMVYPSPSPSVSPTPSHSLQPCYFPPSADTMYDFTGAAHYYVFDEPDGSWDVHKYGAEGYELQSVLHGQAE